MKAATRLRRRASDVLGPASLPLWVGALVPPLAWAAHLLVSDLLWELGCSEGFGRPEIYGIPIMAWTIAETVVLLAVDVAAGLVALVAYRRLRAPQPGNATAHERARAMAVVGLASSALYGLLIAYGLLPPLFLAPCRAAI